VLVLRFCALKLITNNKCIPQGAPSFEVCRSKYSKRAIVTARHNNDLGLTYLKILSTSGIDNSLFIFTMFTFSAVYKQKLYSTSI